MVVSLVAYFFLAHPVDLCLYIVRSMHQSQVFEMGISYSGRVTAIGNGLLLTYSMAKWR